MLLPVLNSSTAAGSDGGVGVGVVERLGITVAAGLRIDVAMGFGRGVQVGVGVFGTRVGVGVKLSLNSWYGKSVGVALTEPTRPPLGVAFAKPTRPVPVPVGDPPSSRVITTTITATISNATAEAIIIRIRGNHPGRGE